MSRIKIEQKIEGPRKRRKRNTEKGREGVEEPQIENRNGNGVYLKTAVCPSVCVMQ